MLACDGVAQVAVIGAPDERKDGSVLGATARQVRRSFKCAS